MTNFVGGHNDTAEAAGVLDDGHAVDLLQALVDDAGTSDVRKAFTGVHGWGVELRILVVKSRTIFTGGSKELLCVCKRCPLKRGGLGGTLLNTIRNRGNHYNQITNNLSLGEVQAKADLTLLKVCTVCLRLCEKIM